LLRFKHVFKLYLIRWIFHPVKLNFTGDDYIPHFFQNHYQSRFLNCLRSLFYFLPAKINCILK